jgi:hypothetical protein
MDPNFKPQQNNNVPGSDNPRPVAPEVVVPQQTENQPTTAPQPSTEPSQFQPPASAAPSPQPSFGNDVAAPQNSVSSAAAPEPYISNPFLTSVDGLIKILKVNPVSSLLVSLYWLVVYIVFLFLIGALFALSPVVGAIVSLVVGVFLLPALIGMLYVIGAASLRDETVGVNRAFGRAIGKLIPIIVLGILSTIMVAIGFVLLIIPGLYLLGRLALAPVALFEEDLGPIAAIKRSFELTKGHVLEVLGAYFAGAVMGGGGLLSMATAIAPVVGRYQGLKFLKESGTPKPKVHWLNWFLPLIVILLTGAYLAFVAFAINQGMNEAQNDPFNTTSEQQIQTQDLFDSQQLQDQPLDSEPLDTTQPGLDSELMTN